MKKTVYGIKAALMAVLSISVASCTEISEFEPQVPSGNASIQVESFPSYDRQTKALGIEDAGKTAWEADDQILLALGDGHYTLTYNGSSWNTDKAVQETGSVNVAAYYAPNYKWANAAEPVLIDGKEAGLDEYLVFTAQHDMSQPLNIDFKDVRDYSRIRVVALAGESVELFGAFTCNAESQELTSSITATADQNGNAFFFGNWAEKAPLTFKVSGLDFVKTMPFASVAGNAFVTYTAGFEYDSSNNLFKIKDARALRLFANLVNSGSTDLNAFLVNDIDLSEICGPEVGEWLPIGSNDPFYGGTFDGNGKTVSNLYINGTKNKVGLFAISNNKSTIKNVKVSGSVKGAANIGGVVGMARGKVYDCDFSGDVTGTGNYVGGIAGYNDGGMTDIARCFNHATVTAAQYAGGIAGALFGGQIEDCINTGKVEAISQFAGGIIGYMQKAAVGVALVNHGIVQTPSMGGGICGYLYGKGSDLFYCINTGKSSGGGLFGKTNAWPVITSSYTTGVAKYGAAANCWNTSYVATYWTGATAGAIGGGSGGNREIIEVNGTDTQWAAGTGTANAMENMNAQKPELGWKYVPNETGDAEKMPLLLVKR